MKRKVILQASQAYTITLPITWIRENNITKDSEVNLIPSGKSIIIKSDFLPSLKSIKLNLNNINERNLYMHIAAAYAQGIDEVEVNSEKEISSKITRSLRDMMGYVLVLNEGERYLIKDINPGNYPNLDEIFKRVFQMILLFYESAKRDIFGSQKENLEDLKSRDGEVNKFTLYLQRAINKMSYEDQVRGKIIFTYSYALEKISDEIERLWKININKKIKKSKEIEKLFDLTRECLEKAFDLYYFYKKDKIEELYSLREQAREMSLKVKGADSNTTRFIRHIVKIAEDSADLSHLAIMKSL